MTAERRKYIVVLAVAAAAILTIGWLLRPEPDARRGPEPTPSDLERLAQLARRRTVEDEVRYFSSVADRAAASLVEVDDAGLTGVVWAGGLIVTANTGSRVPSSINVTAMGQTHAGRTGAGGPRFPVLTVRAASVPSPPVQRRAPETVESGAWVLAVWRSGGRRAFASGHLVGVRPRSADSLEWQEVISTVSLAEDMRGGGLFDLDGRLLGIILPGDRGPTVLAESSVDAMLEHADTLEARIRARYGMSVGPPTDAEREHLEAQEGLVVREVWDGYAADAAGLAPGDVIVSANDVPVTGLDDLAGLAAVDPPAATALGVRWRSTGREVTLSAGRVSEGGPDVPAGGLGWESAPDGHRIARVAPGSRAAEAGLQSGDWLLRIDRMEPRSLEQVERLLAQTSGAPRFLEVRRGARRLGFLF